MIEEDPAQTAWDRSGAYQWLGEPVTWANRQRHLWRRAAQYADHAQELNWLLAMWIGQLDKRGMQNAERSWRQDKDDFLDRFLDWADQFDDDGAELEEAAKVYVQIWTDEDASRDEVEAPPEEAADDAGTPKKLATQPITQTEYVPSPV